MFKRKRSSKGYWFTIQSPNGQTLATSETYTTAAMRDKGIEAVKKVVMAALDKGDIVWLKSFAKKLVKSDGLKWLNDRYGVAHEDNPGFSKDYKFEPSLKKKGKTSGNKKDGLQFLNEQYGVPPALLPNRRPSDTFHIENKKGKIVKR